MGRSLKLVVVLQLRQQGCRRCRRNWRREMPWWGLCTASQEFWCLGIKVPRSTKVPKSSSTLSASMGDIYYFLRWLCGWKGGGVKQISRYIHISKEIVFSTKLLATYFIFFYFNLYLVSNIYIEEFKVKTTISNDLLKSFSGTCILGQHICKRNHFEN